MSSVHDFDLKAIDGKPLPLANFQGKVLLLVNVASECGLTPQYAGLQALHEKYGKRGFNVVGLPCNQFANQEPGSEAEIQQFCDMNYHVTFPMTAKVEVNGADRHPLYEFLAGQNAAFPGDITWNFEKFLIGKRGQVLQRFSPKVTPDAPEVAEAIEKELAA
ncbi:MAG: glutathione peroxidase [Proteobacteria bacterium]|nr:MAG: glutathione peroxidase [Pseudomonadota bacterium]